MAWVIAGWQSSYIKGTNSRKITWQCKDNADPGAKSIGYFIYDLGDGSKAWNTMSSEIETRIDNEEGISI